MGRERVLRTLRLAADDAVLGRGGLALLAGEPGVGKTRLAEEICAYARSRGAAVAWGGCWEGDGAPGFWPWVQVLRSLTRGGEGTSLLGELGVAAAEIGRLIPEATTLVGEAPVPLMEAGQERFRLFDAIGGLLRVVCRSQPVVAVLDDLQWCDTPSLRLLRFLAQELRTLPVLILGAYRDVELVPGHALVELLGELTWCQHISLRGLPQQNVAELVAAISGIRLSPRATETLQLATDGNPFFIREVASFMPDQECLSEHTVEDLVTVGLTMPGGVTAVINRRVDRLSAPCVRLLEAAAVVGQEFDLDVLSSVMDQPDEASRSQAAEAVRSRLLARMPGWPARFRFVHALVRQALYSGLRPEQRIDLHARTAKAIEQRHRDDLETRLAEVAHHLWEAGTDPAKAADYTAQAGHRAMRALAYEEAVNHFTRGIDILQESAPGFMVRRCDLMLLLADAQMATANAAAARQTLKQAAALAQQAGAADRLARAALAVGTVYTFGVLDHLEIGLLEAALKELPESEPKLRARVLARLAKALVLTPDLDRRMLLSEQAVALARQTGDAEVLGWVLLDRHVAIWGFAPVPERLDIATKIVHLAEQVDDRDLLVRGHILRMANLLELGDIAGYSAAIQTYEHLTREYRLTQLHWHVPMLHATEAHIAGRLTEAERLAETGLTMGQRVDQPDIETWYLVARFLPKIWQGRSEEIEPLLRRLINKLPAVPVLLRTTLALLLVETGRAEEAVIELERQAADNFSQLPRDFTWLTNMAGLAAICHCVDDRHRAEILYDLLLPHAPYLLRANQTGVGCGGPVAYFLGLLAITLGRKNEAMNQLQAAIAINERIGAPLFAAQARSKLADCLEAHAQREDRQRITELRQHAHTVMHALDARPIFQPAKAPQQPHSPAATLRQEGDYWTIQHSTAPIRIKDRVGLHYLARLLTAPGHEFHVLDLAAKHTGSQPPSPTGLGPILDNQAKTAYRHRLTELTEELREAEAFGDYGRTETIRREIEALTDQLAAAVGLGGRDRLVGSDAERARTAVTKAIKSVIAHIAMHDPILGGHLSQAIKTGTYCAYTPDPTAPLDWTF